jgi:hypothetical protein
VTEPGNPASEAAPAIRWASFEDARAIAAIHIASWHAAYRGLMPDEVLDALTIAKRERDWLGWLADGGEGNRRAEAFLSGWGGTEMAAGGRPGTPASPSRLEWSRSRSGIGARWKPRRRDSPTGLLVGARECESGQIPHEPAPGALGVW